MSDHSFKRGVEDAKNGLPPNPPKTSNTISDYVFFTTLTKEQMEKDREDYYKGYMAGSSQKGSN